MAGKKITKQITMAECRRIAREVEQAQGVVKAKQAALAEAVDSHLSVVGGSLREIAKRIDFSPPYIHDVRNGRRQVSAEFLERIAAL